MADRTTWIDNIQTAQAQKEVTANDYFDADSPGTLFGRRAVTTNALTWGYYGGRLYVDGVSTLISNGTVSLTGSTINYVEATRAGVVSVNTTGFTSGRIPLYQITTNGSSSVTDYLDLRVSNYSTYSYTTVNVAGSSNVTLTATQARNGILKLTGTITANIELIVPDAVKQYTVDNSSTGAFTITVKTASGTGVIVDQGTIRVVHSDGTNVLAVSSGSGTVTSVALSMPTGVFDVSGSPVTSSGTLAVAFDNQSANTVFAGPTSGGAATPAFRTLVNADIPAAGSSNQIQYNASNLLASEAAFTYDPSTNTLAVDNVTVGVAGTVPTASENDNDTSLANTAFVVANILGAHSTKGNASQYNATTPNSKFDLIADTVVLRNSNNHIVVVHSPSTVTNDTTVAGSTADGRDQSGAFSASSWLHFYWIWNGSTLASVSSTVAPPTGPTLPSGYTHWAYCGAVRYDGSSNLIKTRIRGNYAWRQVEDADFVLSAGQATTFTAVDLSARIPPNALLVSLFSRLVVTDTTIKGFNALVRPTGSGMTNGVEIGTVNTQITLVANKSVSAIMVPPGTSSQIDYLIDSAPDTSGGLYLEVQGYTLPN